MQMKTSDSNKRGSIGVKTYHRENILRNSLYTEDIFEEVSYRENILEEMFFNREDMFE